MICRKTLILCLLFLAGGVSLGQPARGTAGAVTVAQWTRFEAQLTSDTNYQNAVQDIQVEVDFRSPSGKAHTVAAFWDGDKTWKVRFSPEETGVWTYRTRSSKESDLGLHAQTGSFTCRAYRGTNPLYRHGSLRVSADRRYLMHADQTPFFWLADTAWNGPLKADARSWEAYLADRAAKGFNVVQFVATQWRSAAGNADARPAFYGREKIAIDPAFYQWMDERVDAMNRRAIVAAPVLIWAIGGATAPLNPGQVLPDDQIIVLARYMVARYGAHQVVWMLAGDSDYRGEKAERWKKIGRAVFGERHHRLATMHPGGRMWVAEEFRDEPWFSFNGYQSGHGDGADSLRWLTEGPPRQEANKQPPLAHINLEPNYEDHIARPSQTLFDALDVRRAAYWSLLIAPPAGVTYGGHGIWSWELKPVAPMTHPYTGVAKPWHEAMLLPGSAHMKHLKNFFSLLEWWRLRPDQTLLVEQPGTDNPLAYVAAAKTDDGSLGVVYIPEGRRVMLKLDGFSSPVSAEWFNPSTGLRTPAGTVNNQGTREFRADGGQDWLLVLKALRVPYRSPARPNRTSSN